MYKKLNIGLLFNKNQILADGHIKLMYDLIKSNKYKIKYNFEINEIDKNNFLNDLFFNIIFFF